MLKKVAVIVLLGMLTIPSLAQSISVEIKNKEVEYFCIFDGSVFSAGSTICSSMPSRALICRAKGTKVTPPITPATTYLVAT